MSNSHVFSTVELTEYPKLLSQPRFDRYLNEMGGDVKKAMILYSWNMEVSEAFMSPIHVLEVSFRNAVAHSIQAIYGANWPFNNGFVNSLRNPRNPRKFNPRRELLKSTNRYNSVGQIVADLPFAFWEAQLISAHIPAIWNSQFAANFVGPHPNNSLQTTLQIIKNDMEKIRRFRNRIAHHEPVYNRDLAIEFNRIRKTANVINPHAALWIDKAEKVTGLVGLGSFPKQNSN